MAQITLNSSGVASSGSLVLQSNGTTTAVTIDSSQRAAFVAGTAAAPAITTSGDTNTGIFFPAADTIAFAEGGTESMRLDSSGNFLLGTTTAVSGAKATVSGSVAASAGISVAGNAWGVLPYTASSLVVDTNAGTSRLFSIGPDASTKGALLFYQSTSSGSATQAMTLDASGNLALNTTSPTNPANKNFTVNGGSTDAAFVLSVADTRIGQLYAASGSEVRLSAVTSVPLTFRTADTERARIDSSGNLLVGATSTSGTPRLHIKGSSNSASDLNFFFINSTGSTVLAAYNNGALYADSMKSGAGTNAVKFSTSTGQITYDTSSARYKDNIRDSVYGLNHVMQMRSAQFEYKDDGRSDVGLIAEELDPIIPELVGKNKEGQPDSVSYDRMVSVLVKSIQEQQAIITALTARIEALEQA